MHMSRRDFPVLTNNRMIVKTQKCSKTIKKFWRENDPPSVAVTDRAIFDMAGYSAAGQEAGC